MHAPPPWSRTAPRFADRLEVLLFSRRRLVYLLFVMVSLALAWQGSLLPVGAAFDRSHPARHPVSVVDHQYRASFGGGNLLYIALTRSDGDIYDPAFLARLKAMTDAVAELPGIDRSQVHSLVLPALRQVVVAEGNHYSSSLMPQDGQAGRLDATQLAQLRASVARADLGGRYVSADQRSAIIEAAFLDRAADGAAPEDPRRQAAALRERLAAIAAGSGYQVRVLSAPTLAVALFEAAPRAALLALAGLALTLVAASLLLGSPIVAALAVVCALLAPLWQLGLMQASGLSLAPEAGLALWLTFSLALLAALLQAAGWLAESADGARAGFEASLRSWRKSAAPIAIAMLSTAAGAVVLALYSDIELLRDIALGTAMGLGAAAVVNGLLLPTLLSSVRSSRVRRGPDRWLGRLLQPCSAFAGPGGVVVALVVVAALIGWSAWQADGLQAEAEGGDVGRLPSGHPLRVEAEQVASAFPRGIEHLEVIAELARGGCRQADALAQVDRLAWWLRNVPGVAATASMPQSVARVLSAFAEGSPKFAVLPRDREALARAVPPLAGNAGLQDRDCGALPVTVFLERRDPATLAAVAAAAEAFNQANALEFYAVHPDVDAEYCASQRKARARGVVPTALSRTCPVQARPALGPLARDLARQQVLAELRLPALAMLLALFAVVTWLLLADTWAALAIALPVLATGLVLPGVLALAGVVVDATVLPLALLALGGGLAMNLLLHQELRMARSGGRPIAEAWRLAVTTAGRGALLATVVVALACGSWLAATLPLQRDIGIALLAAGLLNLLFGLLLLPAIAALQPAPVERRLPPRVAPQA